MKFSVLSLLLILFGTIFTSLAFAEHSIDGILKSKNLNVSVGGVLDINGELKAKESVYIECDHLKGIGFISAPYISIETKEFEFLGTIECESKCTIVSEFPFDEAMFTFIGDGELVLIVEEKE